MTSLKDKIVLVTGASAGIGQATALLFATEGAKLILVARRKEKLQSLAVQIRGEARSIELDVRDPAAVQNVIADLPVSWSEIDILVNNAGLSRGLEKIQDGNPDSWDEMIDTNIKGLLYMSRAVLPGMVKRNRGDIINIGSIAGHEMYPSGNVYSATKHAVKALTKGMLYDLVNTNVRVSSIDPGLVETEFSQVRFYGDKEKAASVYQGYKPLRPEDVAEAVLFAASRPPQVQIAEMVVLPTAQAGSMLVHKEQ